MSNFNEHIRQVLKDTKPLSVLKDDTAFNTEEQLRIAKLLKPLIEAGNSGDEKLKKTLGKLLRQFIWNATAFCNEGKPKKYVGQPYWSEEAILHFLKQKYSNYTSSKHTSPTQSLIHEHAIPIKFVVQKVINEPSNIANILTQYARAVIITKNENMKVGKKFNDCLPDDFGTHGNLLCRYATSGVSAIYDVRKIELINGLITGRAKYFKEVLNKINSVSALQIKN